MYREETIKKKDYIYLEKIDKFNCQWASLLVYLTEQKYDLGNQETEMMKLSQMQQKNIKEVLIDMEDIMRKSKLIRIIAPEEQERILCRGNI